MAADRSLIPIQLDGEEISEKKMLRVWQLITEKPFPFGKIEAYLLENEEFERVAGTLDDLAGKGKFVDQTLWEYGKKRDFRKADGLTALIDVEGTMCWVILAKKHGKQTLEEILKHELDHISKNEVIRPR